MSTFTPFLRGQTLPWIALVSFVLAACGGSRTGRDADAGTTEPDASGGSFRLNVVNGHGSGVYAVGETVHVWSAVSTVDEVALPWTGEASLLGEPNEWHSTLVMPAHDVELVANTGSQELTLTVEQFNGSTTVPKTVRYYFPPAMRGVVIFSHGTGGSNTYIESTEAFAIALAMVHNGYGVLGTECEEAASGNAGPDGKIRWNKKFVVNNVDLKNLQILFADLEMRGLIPAGTPKFALGMSAGGSQSHFLGAIGASTIASSFPQLRFNAVVGYCSDATSTNPGTLSTTPSAWFMCGSENNPEVSNDEAFENYQTLSGRGIPADYIEHPPSPLYDERFTRVAGISAETSAAMAAELRAADFVDDDSFINTDGNVIGQFIIDNPGSFPTIVAQTEYLGAIHQQVRVMRAEHAMYSDYTQRTIAWFEQFNPNP
ncbi:MAG: hypothetical protein FJ109_11615 [Deltaproteobacteria bacterium]|nr:hypothetical protein [Deltaproteobacteria bacterium]